MKVSPRHLLTAAHCVQWVEPSSSLPRRPALRPAYRGGASIEVSNAKTPHLEGQWFRTTIVATHVAPAWFTTCAPGCTSGHALESLAPDVAVVEVAADVPGPQATIDPRPLVVGAPLVHVGYGCEEGLGGPSAPTPRLKINRLGRLPASAMRHAGSRLFTAGVTPEEVLSSYWPTTGRGLAPSGGSSTCPGDSGAPLYLDEPSQLRVVGVNAYYTFGADRSVSQTNLHTRLDGGSRHRVLQWLQTVLPPVSFAGGVSQAPPTHGDVFHVWHYLSHNPDLPRAGIVSAEAAAHHWTHYGMREGRTAHPVFAVREYLANQPDVSRAFGGDVAAAVQHWVNYGRLEGRGARTSTHPAVFDCGTYLSANRDLLAAGLDTCVEAQQHWLNYGLWESRVSHPRFRIGAYRSNNPDVAAACGSDNRCIVNHCATFGVREGRCGG